jgi:hypothetical protein
MKRLGYAASAAMVMLGLALSPAALAAGHGGGGFGGHIGGFGGHFGGFGSHVGDFGGERAPESSFRVHPLDGGSLPAGRGFVGGEHELGDRGHQLSNDLAVGGRIGDSHIMFGRVPRFGRGGAFLGYYYPDPGVCYQYPGYYNPAVGCYGLYPIG